MTELMEKLAADVGGRYVVERELGRGGMATVYLARDLLDERRVAIKVMDPELSAAVGAERFRREIAVASRLEHPHILGIIASGEAAGTMYYVMPYVQGESLRDRLDRETQLPMEDAIRIAREVADALDYAHRQGVIHRDIKPENILLENGRALVADFGIARAAEAEGNSTLTKTGTALGTPHYMSPEQVMGEKKEIDGRTDQYALGCMLYEMLAGQPPFVGPHAQSLMAQHVLDEPKYVTRFRQTTPSNVEDAILTTLAKNKQDRFATMRDFVVALENTGFTSTMVAARKMRETQVQLPAAKPPMAPWKRAAIAAAVLLVGGGVAAGTASYVRSARGATINTDDAVKMRRLAVLYFKTDRVGDLPVLADAVTEGVIARLRTVNALTVASRNAVAPLRDSELASDSIARLLDVGALVTGSMSRDGRRVRVDVQLRNAAGAELTSLTVTDTVGGARFAESLADTIAGRLRLLMGRVGRDIETKARRATTENLTAWTTFQRGQQFRARADSLLAAGQSPVVPSMLDSADARYAEAAQLDDRWSAPVVGRAWVAITRARIAAPRPPEAAPWLDSAVAFANVAIANDDTDADAYEARGTAHADRLRLGLVASADAQAVKEQAEADLTQATTLNATQASAWSTLSRLAYSGADRNAARAKSLAERAYEADAYLADARSVLGRLFITSHDLDQYIDAKKYCDEGHRRFPTFPFFTSCKLMVLTMKNAAPAPGEAWRWVDSLKTLTSPTDWPLESRMSAMYVAVALLREGTANPARQQALADSARRVVEQSRGNRTIDPTDELLGREAFVLAQLGDTRGALDLIERYVSAHPEHVQGFKTGNFWGWAPLRNEPRFQNILQLAR